MPHHRFTGEGLALDSPVANTTVEEGLVWSGQTLLKCLSEAFDGFLILLKIDVNQPWCEGTNGMAMQTV